MKKWMIIGSSGLVLAAVITIVLLLNNAFGNEPTGSGLQGEQIEETEAFAPKEDRTTEEMTVTPTVEPSKKTDDEGKQEEDTGVEAAQTEGGSSTGSSEMPGDLGKEDKTPGAEEKQKETAPQVVENPEGSGSSELIIVPGDVRVEETGMEVGQDKPISTPAPIVTPEVPSPDINVTVDEEGNVYLPEVPLF